MKRIKIRKLFVLRKMFFFHIDFLYHYILIFLILILKKTVNAVLNPPKII